jgi:hypothetical protein
MLGVMVEEEQQQSESAFMTALARLRDGYGQAAEAIHETAEAQQAFEAATALADALRQLAEHAADLRARAAARIASEEKLSLAVLATRIGVSKARAGQLIQSTKKADDPSSAHDQEISNA